MTAARRSLLKAHRRSSGMSRRTVSSIASDIRALKIQGARRVAKAALEGLLLAAEASRSKKKDEFYDELLAAARLLIDTRPTEPMCNGITAAMAPCQRNSAV